VELYPIKHTCIEQPRDKSGFASPMISISVDTSEKAPKKKINPTPAITLEAIVSNKIQTYAEQYLERKEPFSLVHDQRIIDFLSPGANDMKRDPDLVTAEKCVLKIPSLLHFF
jgi:hypothetical protein